MRSRPFLSIALFVVCVHAALMAWVVGFSEPPAPVVASGRLIAKTVVLAHEASVSESAAEQAPPKKVQQPPSPKKEQAPVKVQQAKTPPPKKKAEQKVVKKAVPQVDRKRQLLATAKAQFDKGSGKEKSLPAPALTGVETITVLHIDAVGDAGYHGMMASFLKRNLRLPEMGEVKVELTLDREGKVLATKTVAAESKSNRKYLEAELPAMRFPPFRRYFEGEKQRVFLLTLTNDR